MALKDYQFWFVVGSQDLYGPEVLETVSKRAEEMVKILNSSGNLPCEIIYKLTAKTTNEVDEIVKLANFDDKCAGVITWMHTFSPSKMWLKGIANLQKPYCHLATQYNLNIPNDEIDMDFMNLNQAAHGDREHGFIGTRLRKPRKVIVGFWKDEKVQKKLGSWMRVCVGVAFSKKLKVMRFNDNMRNVAVTEGDKIMVQEVLGWEVNSWPVGQLVDYINEVSNDEVKDLLKIYKSQYIINTDNIDAIKYQAKEEIAIKRMLDEQGCKAFTNTFEDLYGMEQLPGLASQHLMMQGYGYGGEGDWKVSAMTSIVKAMSEGMDGGTSFMEDYTYELQPDNEYSLGAHMLEVCPSVAADKPKIEVHPLGIGGKNDPARLVFEGHAGPAIVISLIDMGGRLRLIVQEIECIKPIYDMPNLPVARVMWKAFPNLYDGVECWIMAGGAHHSVLTYDVSAEQMKDFARIFGIEFVYINKSTVPMDLEKELFLNDIAYKIN
ncbi:MAG: L-arabinose isomerase [Coriobacteriia bacterium]|nr:L-arabinose isomerase [Coriobacteriia bacterium]